MQTYKRRAFLQLLTTAAAGIGMEQGFAQSLADKRERWRLGLLVSVVNNPESVIGHVHQFGIPTVHVAVWDFSPTVARRLHSALDRYGVKATVLFSSGPGPEKYGLYEGPLTFGLVPSRYRRQRVDHLKRASDFAKQVGVPALFNQWGFIPEVPSDPQYEPTVEAVREIATHCRGNGQMFLNETGQETPITLLRTIRDAGMSNIGLVLDAANLVLYGKGNPVDALDVIGTYVCAVHAKGGFYPTDPRYLGKQVPASQHSMVDWPQLLQRLKGLGYEGPITIEAVSPKRRTNQEILSDIAYLEKQSVQQVSK